MVIPSTMNYFRFVLFLPLFILVTSCGFNAPVEIEVMMAELPEKIDFNHHVKPVLSDKCFACHGPDKANQKAGLRLDIAENAYKALKDSGKHPIVPGKPENSEAIRRILSDNPEIQMPPPEFKVELSQMEKAILTKWVEQGAKYKPHWSFIKPKKESLPQLDSNLKKWSNNEIDYFVANKLKQESLVPSERASREALIRRLSFDLIGLPPTLRQIEDFVNDTSKNAYEKIVDRLLASPAYGERMAADWMDVARYTDSDGYLDDKHRELSPYRDWVIKAFNENMPYDLFATWQLAGDLIEKSTQESILATAFNRLHKRNSEAGIIFEEYRVEYVADRTLSVGKAFLGLSIECARCHDHKYDPISQKDHYEMFAFFNSTNEIGTAVYGPGQVPGPSLLLTNDEQDRVLEYIDRNIHSVKKELVAIDDKKVDLVDKWAATPSILENALKKGLQKGLVAAVDFDRFTARNEKTVTTPNKSGHRRPVVLNEPEVRNGRHGKGVFFNDYSTITLPEKVGWFDQSDPFTIAIAVHPDGNYEETTIYTHCQQNRLGLKGYSMHLENNHLKFIIARS